MSETRRKRLPWWGWVIIAGVVLPGCFYYGFLTYVAVLVLSVKTVGPLQGRIAFAYDRDGNFEIYTIDADRHNLTRLTDDPGADYFPEWSPDGTRIAFSSDRSGTPQIYVMDADGTNITQLTDGQQADTQPTWSPDGSEIAFEHGGGISRMKLDGSDPVPLVGLTIGTIRSLSWSPDGQTLLYSVASVNHAIIVSVAIDDGTTTTLRAGWDPVWSPDGTRIAFAFNDENNPPQLYVMNADGSNVTQLTFMSDIGTYMPSWSPDGQNIVIQYWSPDNRGDLYLIPGDGGTAVFLINSDAEERDPDWSPIP
jgi:Tol biopolymer transport system component